MPIPKIDGKKCAQRNRVVARKGEIEAFPIRFRAGEARPAAGNGYRAGYLPASTAEALAMIRGLQPDGATPLEAEDVYVHLIEAANSNFIGDRYMFLGESTLQNIAAAGPRGVSFMNSHRTGDLSTPSELPFGQSFAGQFEAVGGEARATLGVFLRRGIQPNGANGPSTDDLHAMIEAGALRDVSVGLYGGDKTCDVCGQDYTDGEQCSHFAGTTRNMTEEQKQLQLERGVPNGRASYTLHNATLGEVSAVFDGAVPAAGVRKILAAGREALSAFHLQEAREAFGSLLPRDFDEASPTEDAPALPAQLLDVLSAAVEQGVTAALAAQPSADLADNHGESPMIETTQQQQPAEGDLQAQVAQLQAAQAASEEAARAQAAEIERLRAQNERLERERLTQRFTAEVAGHNGGQPWAGDHARHVGMLTSLATAFGEESSEFRFYVEQNRAHAEQLQASALFTETGRDARGPLDLQSETEREIDARVKALRAGEPALTYAQAYSRVIDADPKLYAKLRQE